MPQRGTGVKQAGIKHCSSTFMRVVFRVVFASYVLRLPHAWEACNTPPPQREAAWNRSCSGGAGLQWAGLQLRPRLFPLCVLKALESEEAVDSVAAAQGAGRGVVGGGGITCSTL